LPEIAKMVFLGSGLVEIALPSSIEVLSDEDFLLQIILIREI
jgi:hypothetical protein